MRISLILPVLAAAMKRSALRHQLVSARTPAACSEALDHMLPLRSAKEYGLAIKACGQCGLPARSLSLLRLMPEPDLLAYNSALSALARDGHWRICLRILNE